MNKYKQKWPFAQIVNSRLSELYSKASTESNLSRDYTYRSNAEKEIEDFLKSNNIQVIPSYKKLGFELDLYLPDYDLAIEYNGLRWHSEWFGKKYKTYHLEKTEKCDKQNIRLIHIFEDEWIYKQDIVKEKLLNLTGKNTKKVFARKCVVQELKSSQANEFFEKTHIQGKAKAFKYYGLFYKNILVSCIAISKLRKSLGQSSTNDSYEINRYASLSGYNVIGGFSKLLKHTERNLNFSSLVSYADKRWSSISNNVYEKTGFKLVKNNNPNYWYVVGNKRYHRYNFTKSRIVANGGDPNLTEIQNMKAAGYDRIWDCGTLKYVYSP